MFNEIAILTTFNNEEFIPKLIKIFIENDLLIITMSYEGPTLSNKQHDLDDYLRIKYFNKIIVQMGYILKWLKSNRIIHMDIKLSNICWGLHEEPNLKIIDFGFAIHEIPDLVRFHCGTYTFADPSYLQPRVHNSGYDMYSTGIMLFYWLTSYIYNTQHLNGDPNKLLRQIGYYKLIHLPNINKNTINLLKRMINYDENLRSSPDDLININNVNIQKIKLKEIIPTTENIFKELCDKNNNEIYMKYNYYPNIEDFDINILDKYIKSCIINARPMHTSEKYYNLFLIHNNFNLNWNELV